MPELIEGWRPVEPIPASAAAAGRTEQCPVCLKWMSPQRNGFIRPHKRPVFVPGDTRPFDTERCPGAGTEDRRQYRVISQAYANQPLSHRALAQSCCGRRAAERFANAWKALKWLSGVEILERDG